MGDGFTELGFGVRLQLAQDHCADFWRGVSAGLAPHGYLDMSVAVGRFDDVVRDALELILNLIKFAAHEALDGKDRVLRVGDALTLGGLTHHAFAGFGKCHDRRGRACAFAVFEHHRFPAFHDCHARVGGAEVDA